MRILYHHRTQGRGVEGVHIREVVRGWRQKGHSVDVAGPPGVTIEDSPGHGAKSLKGSLYGLISGFMPEIAFEAIELAYNLKAGSLLDGYFSRNDYGLYYERYAFFNYAGVSKARKKGLPVILEINFMSDNPLVRKRSLILRPLQRLVERRVFNMADGFVAVSSVLKERLVQMGIDGSRVEVMTNAADPDVFNPAISGEKTRRRFGLEDSLVIGFVGGFYPWHGVGLLLDAFKEICGASKNACVLLVGDGPERKDLEDKVKRNGLEKRVFFAGSVNNKDLPQYLAAFDIAVMPDSNDYGSPMKIYEYMSMARPVVAPRLKPIEDGVTDGVHGLLFTPGDARSLVNALSTLLEKKDLRARMGASGRGHILKEHTWVKNADRVLDLRERLLSMRGHVKGFARRAVNNGTGGVK